MKENGSKDENENENEIEEEQKEETEEIEDMEQRNIDLNDNIMEDGRTESLLLEDIIRGEYKPVNKKKTMLNALLFGKYSNIIKDFFFMFILLLSSSLNFSWLYLPFIILSFICYFLLFKKSESAKKIKIIIEYISLFYSIILLIFKIIYIIKIKNGARFENKKDLFLDLGIVYLLKVNRNLFLVITFIGEALVCLTSIISLIISYLCYDFDTDENIRNNMTSVQFFKMMAVCIYLVYVNVFCFAIFNTSVLTLCYITPLNIVIYFLSMNSNRRLLFYIFKILCVIMILAISCQIILINILNVYTIRRSYITNEEMPYPRIINYWTKFGINQAFNENMSITKIICEFFAYFFAVGSLLSMILSYKKLTYERMLKSYNNKSNENEEEEEENIFVKFFERILNFFVSPAFIIHLCRISAILWLYYYQNYYSLGVIIWLLFSFFNKHIKSNRFVTIILLSPMVIVCLFCYHLSNINGFFNELNDEKFEQKKSLLYSSFGIKKFKHKNIEYFLCYIFYFLVNLFTYTIFIEIDKKKENNKQNNDLIEKEEIQNENSEDIKKDFEEGNYIKIREALGSISLLSTDINKIQENLLEDKEIDQLYNNLTLFNIFLKSIFSNIDKLTLVGIYFLTINSINLLHIIIVLLFMCQLLIPLIMIRFSVVMIIINQLFFFFEYIMHLFKSKNYSENTVKIIKLLIPYDTDSNAISIEYLIYLVVYCYYIQYQLYNYQFYQKLAKNKNISLSLYIEIQLSEFPIIKKILFFIGRIINELYIWSLIIIFIFFNSYFEISFLFAIKLLIFLFIVFGFLQSIRNNKPNKKSMIFNWSFLVFCAFNTIGIYVYQTICLSFLPYTNRITNSKNFWIKNLPAIGFYRYNEKDLFIKFLPHFISNLISVLLIKEMERILKKAEDKEEEETKIENGEIVLNIEEDTKNKLLLKKNSLRNKEIRYMLNNQENIKEQEVKDLDDIRKEMPQDKNIDNNINNEIKLDNDNIKEGMQEKDNIKEEDDGNDDIKDEEEKEEDKEEEEKISPAQEYEQNRSKMDILQVKYFFFNIILLFTKFYWLYLFLSICIIFTTYNLSILLVIYILIFSITFIRMFRHIISKLTSFISKESFFISRLIRYNLIEQTRHINENSKYRALAFKYLLIFSFISYYLSYLYGIFYLIQHGCPGTDCDENYKPIENIDEDLIIAISYIFGFHVNLKKETVLFAGWEYLFFIALICFDVYAQKLEDYYNDLCKKNRKKYSKLANRNIQLKPLTLGEDNFVMNVQSTVEKARIIIEEEEEENKKDVIDTNTKENQIINKTFFKKASTIKFNIDSKGEEEDIKIGKKLIESFLLIFEKASKNEVKLSKLNKKYIIIQIFKKIFEEIIIFLLICTAISKLNIWSFIYMLFALFLIITTKSMMKYYFLYCFLIATILLQSVLFVSNLQIYTDPNPDEEALSIMNRKFHIPWYKKNDYSTNGTNINSTIDYKPIINISDQKAFFLGFGVSHSQINLIWMDFIEVVIIYIYLDYFSYSIYQEVNSIGKKKKKANKINYYNLFLNTQVRDVSRKLSENEYQKHKDCMKYNFDLDILDYDEFQYYMSKGKYKIKNEEKIKLITDGKENEEEKDQNEKEQKKNEEEEQNDNENIKKKKVKIIGRIKKKDKLSLENLNDSTKIVNYNTNNPKVSNFKESPIYKSLKRVKSTGVYSTNIMSNLKENEKFSNKCYDIFIQFLYLSSHNVILIVIIIVSMMISGVISFIYILISLFFLITSTRIYLGKKYSYPKKIKRWLRIMILIDISLQILFQSPYIDTKDASDDTKSTFYTILENIGLNKILSFDFSQGVFDAIIDGEQMILVMAKAFIYLFMSLQILVYSSQNFQEYYLSYIITKNNNLRRISLMNVFKFNNKRIEVLENSIHNRQEMSKEIGDIENTLEKWNDKLKKLNQNRTSLLIPSIDVSYFRRLKSSKKKNLSLISKDSIRFSKENIGKRDDSINSIRGSKIINIGNSVLSNLKMMNENRESQNLDIIQEENDNLNNLFMKNPFDDEEELEEYVDEKKVFEKMKNWILGGFLIRLQIKLHRYASDYNNISRKERDIYEKDTIQGKIETTSYIENLVKGELKTLDLAHFTEEELKEVKSFFDGTREKKLEKRKKEKERLKKLKKGLNKVKFFGKINKLEDINPKKKIKFKDLFDKKDINNVNLSKLRQKTMKKNKTESFLPRTIPKSTRIPDSIELEANNEDVINLNTPKFKQLEKFMKNNIFIKYLKTRYIIGSIIKDCIAFCSNNFHWVCYITMILNHIISSSILSLIYPLSIFCYALLEYPRPPRSYWRFCFIYTVALSSIKFIIQFKFFTTNDKVVELIENSSHYKLGLKICNGTFSKDFFSYIIFDYLVLIMLLINDYLLVFKGLYLKREQEIENIYQAMERVAMTKDIVIDKNENIKKFNDGYLMKEGKKLDKKERDNTTIEKEEIEFIQKFSNINLDDSDFDEERKTKKKNEPKKMGFLERIKTFNKKKDTKTTKKSEEDKKKEKEMEKYDETKRTYYERLFPKIRNEKPGNEYNLIYTLIMVFIIVYLLIFYTNMVQDKTYGAVTVETKQFSGTMVIFLILHIVFLVYDRILYISQNRYNIEYEYILYNKITKRPLSDSNFDVIKNNIKKNYNIIGNKFAIPTEEIDKLQKEYNIVYIQKEEFNCPLLQKYILQLFIVIFGHLFIFFFMPMKGNKNLNNKIYCSKTDEVCNDFLDNKTIIIFYILYVIYFVFSGLQIKFGFYDMKRKSVLKARNNSIQGYIYNIYKVIPFLYEIKLGIDWTFTNTCLDIFQWNKFESVYDLLFITNCQMSLINDKPIGQEVTKILKISMGATLAFGLIIVLILPLILFSSLNPMNQLNNLTSADLIAELRFINSNGIQKDFTIFQNSKPQSINSITDSEFRYYNYTKSLNTKNFPREQIQTVLFSEENEKNWDSSTPQINSLINLLRNRNKTDNQDFVIDSINLVIDYGFHRLLPPGAQDVRKTCEQNIYSKNNYNAENDKKLDILEDALSTCKAVNLTFENIISPPIRLKGTTYVSRLKNEVYFPNLDVQLGFVGCKTKNDENSVNKTRISYIESYFLLGIFHKGENITEGIKFHVFSDQVSSTTLSYSVLTFYAAFVLVVGNYVRNFFTGEPEKIFLTEMPHNEDLLKLCEGIKVSRYRSNFEEEEKLYYILIEIMRSPDYLRLMTNSSIDQFSQRLIKNIENKTTDDI